MILLKTEADGKRKYYMGYDGKKASVGSKGSGVRMDRALASVVLKQLNSLGIEGFVPVDESDTDTAISL